MRSVACRRNAGNVILTTVALLCLAPLTDCSSGSCGGGIRAELLEDYLDHYPLDVGTDEEILRFEPAKGGAFYQVAHVATRWSGSRTSYRVYCRLALFVDNECIGIWRITEPAMTAVLEIDGDSLSVRLADGRVGKIDLEVRQVPEQLKRWIGPFLPRGSKQSGSIMSVSPRRGARRRIASEIGRVLRRPKQS